MARKSEDNLKEKLKNLFGINKNQSPSALPKSQIKEITITRELLREIGPDGPANNRMKRIQELSETVRQKRLEENAVEALLNATSDLLKPHSTNENRQTALYFMQSLLQGQLNTLGILRGHFFHIIDNLSSPDDLQFRFELFRILSENGKNLHDFEDETGEFLLKWMPDILSLGRISDYLSLLINVIKFNAAYLDEDIVSSLVQQTCMIPNRTRSEEDLKLCMEVLDAVVCYSYLPSSSLYHFIAALCHLVNIARVCKESWELMRKLLGTHLGHSSIHTMCCMLQDRRQPVDAILLRGAVFFIGMALWGSSRVQSLKQTATSVLPSFLQALWSHKPIVGHEVILSLQRLVKKYGKDLQNLSWDIILNIIEVLIEQYEDGETSIPNSSEEGKIQVEIHDVLTTIESLHENRQYLGSVPRFFKIIEMCASKRSTHSVSLLIDYHAQSITPIKDKWIINLNSLLDRFFRQERRTDIRKKALDILSFVLGINKHVYEVDLIQNVVLPNLGNIDTDPDPEVRRVAADILLVLAQSCYSQEFFDIMNIIDKILKKALITVPVVSNEEIVQIPDERNLSDVKATALKLVEVFRHKLFQTPSSHGVKINQILIEYIQCQYQNMVFNFTACAIRKSIMECLLKLRSDSLHRLGMADRPSDVQYPFSPYILCYSSGETPEPAVPISPGVSGTSFDLPTSITSVIEYTDIFKLFIECLKKELDWEVLKCVLENLPLVLQNKTLILSTRGDLIAELCHHLAAMVNDRSLGLPEKLKNLRPGFTRADFHTFVFPVLAAMVTYHEYLDRNRQRELIKCLEFGFVSKCAKGCVSSLRICTLEMQDVMMRLLPLVLLSLSKISATISMAIPVLAFLSSIVRLPKLYANFVEDQYMSVFAIALPYTNPFKFSHYTVSLAHHVIAVWFIRCRLPFRKGFVKFIHTGLKANVLQQFEENSKLNLQNQDSSDRGRSGSYTAGTRTRRRMASGSAILPGDQQAPIEEKMSLFHKELTETCTDMMARYTFGNVSTTPQRSPVAQFLLKGGQSQTWLVGNKIITITTSGGGTKTRDNGLCEKCITLYQETQETRHNTSKKSRDRRRHKSTACLSRSHSQVDPVGLYNTDEGDTALPRWSQDDLSLINDDAFSTDSRDDVGVQTGSSLLGSGIDKDPIESLLFGNKGPMPEKRAFSMNQCNCWCTGWAEILIRAPSGNMSWMMRIENETSLFSQPDMSFSDLTLLFAPLCKRPQPSTESDSIGKIDSESLGEDEYESIYSKHFPTDQKPEDPTIISNEPKKETKGFLVPDQEPESTNSSDPIDFPSPSTLRKTNSSPSLIGSYPDDGIMKENKSSPTKNDTVEQISPLPPITLQKIDTSPPPQSPDILPSASEKNSPVIKKSKPVKPVKRNLSNSLLQEIEEAEVATETGEDILIQSDTKEEENVFSDMKDTIPPQMKYVPIDSNKLAPLAISSDQKTHSDTSHTEISLSQTTGSSTNSSTPEDIPEMKTIKPRGHTISVMSPATEVRQKEDVDARSKSGSVKEANRSGISPGFVFLQLFHNHPLLSSQETPVLLQHNETTERAIRILDHIHPYETHKLGVVYVGPGQATNEKAILSNLYGSERYARLVEQLGQLICLRDVNPDQVYTGGLASNGEDGQFAYSWQDDAMQVIFHIATLMPNKNSDPNCNSKKRHIGNDYVTIIYNDSHDDYKIGTIKGSFNYVNIVIKPLDYESNAVTLQTKEDIAEILGHTDTKIISDENLAQLVRQIAMHCNLASMVLQRQQSQPQDPFASNWLERLRQIKRIKQKALQVESPGIKEEGIPITTSRSYMEDFTDYV
ncbi:hypothetical protein SNE40_020258 [Patella caerulea]|uniref:Tuberin n=1 Tax=Patella caerulea TaxID=87958 RepID=A0AAN8GA62_PATCE